MDENEINNIFAGVNITDEEMNKILIEKNDLIIRQVEPYKTGILETRIAKGYEERQQPEDACINFISAASCFTTANQPALARKCLERVIKLTKINSVSELANGLLKKLV